MAAYCQGMALSLVGWLPVHREQFQTQCSVTNMGELYLLVSVNICCITNDLRLKFKSPHQTHHCIQVNDFVMITTKYVCPRSVVVCKPVSIFCHHWLSITCFKNFWEITDNTQELTHATQHQLVNSHGSGYLTKNLISLQKINVAEFHSYFLFFSLTFWPIWNCPKSWSNKYK